MTNLTSSMRLKINRDTFFIPDPNSGVYFRNNFNSFRMEGSMIDQWVQKLIPMFNGEYTLGNLTEGLPGTYRDRVYEIAEVLYKNGYVRDVSQDRSHQLTDQVLKKYASQIEFLDSFGDSGAFRFQVYRQAKVLAIGCGPFFVSLVSALIESGLPKFHILVTDSLSTNRLRIDELLVHARETDPDVKVEEITLQKEEGISWREAVKPFDSILYVSKEGDTDQVRVLNTVCKEEKKSFIPAICLQRAGMAGPLVHPDSQGCWESSWRSMHRSVLSQDQRINSSSSTAEAMLANVIVFELFKMITKVTESELNNQFFLLNLETLEGNWHSFIPHPLVTGRASAEWVQDFDPRLEKSSSNAEPDGLFLFFNELTSAVSGIFHTWEEGDLKQLPLAQCRVQVIDPMSDGPADLLPDIICSDLTHEGALREAALAGIEAYVSQMADRLVTTLPPNELEENSRAESQEMIGVGTGETFSEAVCRGLQICLSEELRKQVDQKNSVSPVHLSTIEDDRCRFYLQALTKMQGAPMIGLGDEVAGFPVVWVGTNNSWYGSVGLNTTLALRKALQNALLKAQNGATYPKTQVLEVPSRFLKETNTQRIEIPSCEEITKTVLRTAIQVLKQNRKELLIFEFMLEPFLKKELAGVFGVVLREEVSR